MSTGENPMKTIGLVFGLVVGAAVGVICQTAPEAWKAVHDLHNRWEGLGKGYNASSQTLELVSFLAEPQRPLYPEQATLNVAFYVPVNAASIVLYAREIDILEQYWMEAKPPKDGWRRGGWNQFGGWKTIDVLHPKIPNTNLGVVVRLDGRYPYDGRVAPALLRSEALRDGQRIASYRAVFVPGGEFAGGRYFVKSGCGQAAANLLVPPVALGVQYSGSPMTISFGLDLNSAADVELIVELDRAPALDGRAAQKPLAGYPPQRYCFAHQPRVAPPL
jgi:hypothetical protein